jgi:hypothetical protein
MRKAEIKYVTKTEYSNGEKITHIGGTSSNRTKWTQSIEKTIQEIEDREWEYFVQKDGHHLKIVVALDSDGNKHLKTEEDASVANFLFNLPSCP